MVTHTHLPKTRLSRLAGHFSGLKRDEAVKTAMQALETMRSDSDAALRATVSQLEKAVDAATAHGEAALMGQLLPLCERIVTLAGTFGYHSLDGAARSLCDLIAGLLRQSQSDLASIRVHIQTMHMLAPGAAPLGKERIEVMMSELRKLLDFHGFAQPEKGQLHEERQV